MMLALGDFRFSVNTAAYQSLRHTSTYNWTSQNRIGEAPLHQNTGRGNDTLDLEGVRKDRNRCSNRIGISVRMFQELVFEWSEIHSNMQIHQLQLSLYLPPQLQKLTQRHIGIRNLLIAISNRPYTLTTAHTLNISINLLKI